MEDYPRNLKEFDVRFRSEEACREYLLQLRWPDGLPSVTGTGVATSVIKTGDIIKVDGTTGIVMIVKRAKGK